MDKSLMIALTVVVGLLVLNAWAVRYAACTVDYSRGQLIGQALVALVLPVVGALLVIYLARNEETPGSRGYASNQHQHEDLKVQLHDYGRGPVDAD
jgi:hypothetical protein